MVTLASEPDGFERTEIVDVASLGATGLRVDAGPLQADETSLRVDLGRALEARFDDRRGWTRARSARSARRRWSRGSASTGRRTCSARASLARYDGRSLDGVDVYAEKNWGAAFADHWWWGQARRGVRGRADPRRRADRGRRVDRPTGLVSLAPPFARTVARAGGGEWRIRAKSARWRMEIEGSAAGGLRLPVPLPPSAGSELRSNHHLVGRSRCGCGAAGGCGSRTRGWPGWRTGRRHG